MAMPASLFDAGAATTAALSLSPFLKHIDQY